MRRITLSLLLVALVFSMALPVFAGETPTKLVLGMVPSREADRMIVSLDGLSELLTAEIGVEVESYVATNFTGLIEAMGTGRVDIGIFGSFQLVLAQDRHDVEIILASVRYGSSTYRAQFNALADSGIETVQDLKGKTVAFVDPTSTSGFLFPFVYLKENGVDPETDLTYIFAGGHDAAVISVINGDVDAALSFEDVRTNLTEEYPDVLETVVAFDYTEPIPNDGVAVRKGLAPEFVEKIQNAFIDLAETETGRELFDELYNVSGFVRADGEQYEVVRRTFKEMEEHISF